MADQERMTDAEHAAAQVALMATIAAAGKMEGDASAWHKRIEVLIPEVVAAMAPGAPLILKAHEMLTATVFTAEFISWRELDSPKRLEVSLVHRVDPDHPDGIQKINTDWASSPRGIVMRAKLSNISKGDRVLCWKVQEPMANGRKVNVLKNIAKIAHQDSTVSSSDGAPTPSQAPPLTDPEPPARSGSGSLSPENRRALADAAAKLPTSAVERLKRGFAAKGIWPPTDETAEQILDAMEAEERAIGEPF